MVCTLIYYDRGDEYPTLETYVSIQDAKDAIIEYGDRANNAQILVDHSNVELYKEKYEEMYKIMFSEFVSDRIDKKVTSVPLEKKVI